MRELILLYLIIILLLFREQGASLPHQAFKEKSSTDTLPTISTLIVPTASPHNLFLLSFYLKHMESYDLFTFLSGVWRSLPGIGCWNIVKGKISDSQPDVPSQTHELCSYLSSHTTLGKYTRFMDGKSLEFE